VWTDRLRHRSIRDPCLPGKRPLLVRYYLVDRLNLGVYLHHFQRSDHRAALHDHPWSFVTLLLSSGYVEHTPAGAFRRRRFSVLWRPATWRHAVEIERPTWTLVIRFRRRREWGFWTRRGFVHYLDFPGAGCE
jgi:hypothetical protein